MEGSEQDLLFRGLMRKVIKKAGPKIVGPGHVVSYAVLKKALQSLGVSTKHLDSLANVLFESQNGSGLVGKVDDREFIRMVRRLSRSL